jgi:hypothetical protein
VANEEVATYRDAIKKLLDAAPLIQKVYQKQIGANPDDRIAAETIDDRELIDRYGHPWCLADAGEFVSPFLLSRGAAAVLLPMGLHVKKRRRPAVLLMW